MNNGYYYQLLAGLSREANRFNYPRNLKDLIRTGDLDDVRKVEELLADEVAESSLHDDNGADYFAHMAETAILFSLYREDYERLNELYALAEKRLQSLRSSGNARINVHGWMWYLGYINSASKRLQRNITIEAFELEIDEIEWDELDDEFIYRVSGVTGFVYLNEEDPSKFNKARFWFGKAIAEVDQAGGLVYFINLADFYLASPNADNAKRIADHIKRLENEANSTIDPNLARLYRAAVLELQARALIFKFGNYDDDHVKIEENLRSVRETEKNIDYEGKNSPAFVRAFLKMTFSKYYLSLTSADLDAEDIEDLLAMALDDVNEAMSIARRMKDEALKNYLRVSWLNVACERNTKVGEKELREIVTNLRNSSNYPLYVSASVALSRYYLNQKNTQKAYEILMDVVKRGNKRISDGGYYLIIKGLNEVNGILLAESRNPGISWIINELDPFFKIVSDMVDNLDENLEIIGAANFADFLSEFYRMEPVSHYNIKVYLRYQFFSIKMMRLSAVLQEDAAAVKLADRVLGELDHKNNPLGFIKADWEEFKDVPNSVRNRVLNKCISISKGDLPLAAEHLDFSYRNLRSYITFKEVNRLGFFLDESDTNMRQMEQGIRLMFFDLYKKGTIFEVVFDMPKFLVEHAKPGFSSQDLEEALNIKGTTAKKYIKIMMEIGLIKLERSIGRKHFYKLRKDNVMNRLGKDQRVLVSR